MAQGSRMVGGVYHPRSKGGAMSDALADAKRAMTRLAKVAAMRGAGLVLFAAAMAALSALASYHGDDASFNNANGRPVSNLLGPLGTIIVAAGLGILPAPHSLPAGAGGWIGIAVVGLSAHAAQIFAAPSL